MYNMPFDILGGILTNKASFEELQHAASLVKAHSRHPSQDFLLDKSLSVHSIQQSLLSSKKPTEETTNITASDSSRPNSSIGSENDVSEEVVDTQLNLQFTLKEELKKRYSMPYSSI